MEDRVGSWHGLARGWAVVWNGWGGGAGTAGFCPLWKKKCKVSCLADGHGPLSPVFSG